jgi:AcrR family transcriptional regulator
MCNEFVEARASQRVNTGGVEKVASERQSKLKRPSQARSVATFANILKASTDIIVERGVQGLNTNVVADRAGVNIGTVYHYFPDKTAILVELFRIDQEHRNKPLTEKLNEICDAPDLDQWADEMFVLSVELRTASPATNQLRRAFRAVPELVAIDRQDTELYLDFISVRLRDRFFGLSEERARAATRLLVDVSMTILDESQELGAESDLYLREGLTALKCYLSSLDQPPT